ncbi:TPA: hypothetical protein N2777_001640 [Vibrio parahaemolyticus]|nr:hypothetical protein [Vibrio parahaemolyticus]
MSYKTVKLGWALGNDGQVKYIKNVERGLKCDCKCPDCGTALVANQGSKKSWYFSHSSNTNCKGESALHLAAKQVLQNAAKSNLSIVTPSISGIVSQKDIMDYTHNKEWQIESNNFVLSEVTPEKSFKDLIVDVLCKNDRQETLVVEIYVTHKKSDIDKSKFKSENLNSIEIDLSDLSWNSTEEQILEAVLNSAPRSWLYCNDIDSQVNQAKVYLRSDIDLYNNQYKKEYKNALDHMVDNGKFDNLYIPSFSARKRGKDNKSVSHEAYIEKELEVTRIDSIFNTASDTKTTTAIISGKTSIKVIFSINEHKKINTDQPFLSFSYESNLPDDLEYGEIKFYGRWYNVEKWQNKIEKIAQQELNKKIQRANYKTSLRDNYSKSFSSLSEGEKLSLIYKKIGISQPTLKGIYNKNWNTTDRVWKSVVFYYSIINNRKDTLNTEAMSVNEWYNSMLNLPMDEKSCTSRSKQIFKWLKHLSKLGYVEYIKGLNFRIVREKSLNNANEILEKHMGSEKMGEEVLSIRPAQFYNYHDEDDLLNII